MKNEQMEITNRWSIFWMAIIGYMLTYNAFRLIDYFSDWIQLSDTFAVQILLFWFFLAILFIKIGTKQKE